MRGLFFHHRRKQLPDGWVSSAAVVEELPLGLRDGHTFQVLAAQPLTEIGNGIFQYKTLFFDDEAFASAWLVRVYSSTIIFGSTSRMSDLPAGLAHRVWTPPTTPPLPAMPARLPPSP